MALKKREDLEAREAVDIARLTRKGAGSLVYALAIVAVVVLVVAISMNYRKSWDFSITRSNQLSPQTREVLQSLTEPVHLYALYTKQEEVQRESYWMLLKQYRTESDMVRVEFIDPIEKPGRVKELGVDPQEQDLRSGGLTLVVRGERRLTFRGAEEEDITNSILEVGRTSKRIIGLLRGYGEKNPGSNSGGGLAAAVQALRQEYYELRDVQVQNGIPEEVSVLLLAGPTLQVPSEDLQVIHAWLEDGGRLLAMLDPGHECGMNELLVPWGLRLGEGQIVDTRENVNQSPPFIRVSDYTDHPVVRAFRKRYPTALAMAAPVSHFETGEGKLFHDDLARSSPYSVILSGVQRQSGPFTVAAASWFRTAGEDADKETRIVLVGDSDFASTAYLPAHANRNLFLNAVGWLSREEQLLSIRKLVLGGQTIELLEGEKTIMYLVLATAPAVLLVIGIMVAWRRRGR